MPRTGTTNVGTILAVVLKAVVFLHEDAQKSPIFVRGAFLVHQQSPPDSDDTEGGLSPTSEDGGGSSSMQDQDDHDPDDFAQQEEQRSNSAARAATNSNAGPNPEDEEVDTAALFRSSTDSDRGPEEVAAEGQQRNKNVFNNCKPGCWHLVQESGASPDTTWSFPLVLSLEKKEQPEDFSSLSTLLRGGPTSQSAQESSADLDHETAAQLVDVRRATRFPAMFECSEEEDKNKFMNVFVIPRELGLKTGDHDIDIEDHMAARPNVFLRLVYERQSGNKHAVHKSLPNSNYAVEENKCQHYIPLGAGTRISVSDRTKEFPKSSGQQEPEHQHAHNWKRTISEASTSAGTVVAGSSPPPAVDQNKAASDSDRGMIFEQEYVVVNAHGRRQHFHHQNVSGAQDLRQKMFTQKLLDAGWSFYPTDFQFHKVDQEKSNPTSTGGTTSTMSMGGSTAGGATPSSTSAEGDEPSLINLLTLDNTSATAWAQDVFNRCQRHADGVEGAAKVAFETAAAQQGLDREDVLPPQLHSVGFTCHPVVQDNVANIKTTDLAYSFATMTVKSRGGLLDYRLNPEVYRSPSANSLTALSRIVFASVSKKLSPTNVHQFAWRGRTSHQDGSSQVVPGDSDSNEPAPLMVAKFQIAILLPQNHGVWKNGSGTKDRGKNAHHGPAVDYNRHTEGGRQHQQQAVASNMQNGVNAGDDITSSSSNQQPALHFMNRSAALDEQDQDEAEDEDDRTADDDSSGTTRSTGKAAVGEHLAMAAYADDDILQLHMESIRTTLNDDEDAGKRDLELRLLVSFCSLLFLALLLSTAHQDLRRKIFQNKKQANSTSRRLSWWDLLRRQFRTQKQVLSSYEKSCASSSTQHAGGISKNAMEQYLQENPDAKDEWVEIQEGWAKVQDARKNKTKNKSSSSSPKKTKERDDTCAEVVSKEVDEDDDGVSENEESGGSTTAREDEEDDVDKIVARAMNVGSTTSTSRAVPLREEPEVVQDTALRAMGLEHSKEEADAFRRRKNNSISPGKRRYSDSTFQLGQESFRQASRESDQNSDLDFVPFAIYDPRRDSVESDEALEGAAAQAERYQQLSDPRRDSVGTDGSDRSLQQHLTQSDRSCDNNDLANRSGSSSSWTNIHNSGSTNTTRFPTSSWEGAGPHTTNSSMNGSSSSNNNQHLSQTNSNASTACTLPAPGGPRGGTTTTTQPAFTSPSRAANYNMSSSKPSSKILNSRHNFYHDQHDLADATYFPKYGRAEIESKRSIVFVNCTSRLQQKESWMYTIHFKSQGYNVSLMIDEYVKRQELFLTDEYGYGSGFSSSHYPAAPAERVLADDGLEERNNYNYVDENAMLCGHNDDRKPHQGQLVLVNFEDGSPLRPAADEEDGPSPANKSAGSISPVSPGRVPHGRSAFFPDEVMDRHIGVTVRATKEQEVDISPVAGNKMILSRDDHIEDQQPSLDNMFVEQDEIKRMSHLSSNEVVALVPPIRSQSHSADSTETIPPIIPTPGLYRQVLSGGGIVEQEQNGQRSFSSSIDEYPDASKIANAPESLENRDKIPTGGIVGASVIGRTTDVVTGKNPDVPPMSRKNDSTTVFPLPNDPLVVEDEQNHQTSNQHKGADVISTGVVVPPVDVEVATKKNTTNGGQADADEVNLDDHQQLQIAASRKDAKRTVTFEENTSGSNDSGGFRNVKNSSNVDHILPRTLSLRSKEKSKSLTPVYERMLRAVRCQTKVGNQPEKDVVVPDHIQRVFHKVHDHIQNGTVCVDLLETILYRFVTIQTANEFDDREADMEQEAMESTFSMWLAMQNLNMALGQAKEMDRKKLNNWEEDNKMSRNMRERNFQRRLQSIEQKKRQRALRGGGNGWRHRTTSEDAGPVEQEAVTREMSRERSR